MTDDAKTALLEMIERFERRSERQIEFLEKTAGHVLREQRHTRKDSPERHYWHYGYATALRDAVRMLKAIGKHNAGN